MNEIKKAINDLHNRTNERILEQMKQEKSIGKELQILRKIEEIEAIVEQT